MFQHKNIVNSRLYTKLGGTATTDKTNMDNPQNNKKEHKNAIEKCLLTVLFFFSLMRSCLV